MFRLQQVYLSIAIAVKQKMLTLRLMFSTNGRTQQRKSGKWFHDWSSAAWKLKGMQMSPMMRSARARLAMR